MATQVVIGPSSRKLAESIAKQLKDEKVGVQRKKFPDGESYIRLEKPIKKGAKVVVVQTLFPQNDAIVELLLMLDVVNEFKPKSVTAVIPYFAYARQHKRYLKWEAIAAKTVASLIDAKVDKVLLVDVHDRILLKFFKKAKELSAASLISDHFKKIKDPFVLVPDQERGDFAKAIATRLGCEFSWLSKHRDRETGKVTTKIRKKIDVLGKNVLIVDDIISSGHTMLNAIEILKKLGVKGVYVAATHYLATGAHKKILAAGAKEVVATNSIESEIGKIDIAKTVADELW